MIEPAKNRRMTRGMFGTAHPNAKLTADIVRQIRRLHAAGESSYLLAKKFGVTVPNIHHIIHLKTWRHVHETLPSIERHLCVDIRPGWAMKPADRYHAIPDWGSTTVQCKDTPDFIYIVRNRKPPESIKEAMDMIAAWRLENERAQD